VNCCICGYDKHVCLVHIEENNFISFTHWLYMVKERLKYMMVFTIIKSSS
jgi:hypothetical protein